MVSCRISNEKHMGLCIGERAVSQARLQRTARLADSWEGGQKIRARHVFSLRNTMLRVAFRVPLRRNVSADVGQARQALSVRNTRLRVAFRLRKPWFVA